MTTHHPRAVAAAALAATGLVLAACSSASAPTHPVANTVAANANGAAPRFSPAPASNSSAAAASGAACGLVTAGEAGAVTGKQMQKVGDAGTICVYSATTDPSNIVHVTLYPDVASMALQKQDESGSQHLPGLGDDAFWNAGGSLFVQKGTRGFGIVVPSLALTSSTAPQTILTLAETAAGRL